MSAKPDAKKLFALLKKKMGLLSDSERAKFIEMVITDPEFAIASVDEFIEVAMKEEAGRASIDQERKKGDEERKKNSRRSRKADTERNSAIIAAKASGLSYAQVAKKFGISTPSVRGVIYRAKQKAKP